MELHTPFECPPAEDDPKVLKCTQGY
jgi:hypothetical protein